MIHVKNPVWQVLKFAFETSQAQGLGWLHYKPNDAYTDQMFQDYVTNSSKRKIANTEAYWLDFDYVDGRAVKLSIATADGMDGCVLNITPTNWYDHSQQQINWFLSNLTILDDDVSLDSLKNQE